MSNPSEKRTFIEEIELAGEQLVDKVKDLLHEGNVRRLRVRHEGHTVLEIPVTLAAVGVILAPVLAAVGAVAAALTRCTVEIEREAGPGTPSSPGSEREAERGAEKLV
jgi:Domain of unknown function (DUF4342)